MSEQMDEFRAGVVDILGAKAAAKKVDGIVALFAEYLEPGALSAVEVLGARVVVSRQYDTPDGVMIGYDANGDVSRIEFGRVPVELEFFDRQP